MFDQLPKHTRDSEENIHGFVRLNRTYYTTWSSLSGKLYETQFIRNITTCIKLQTCVCPTFANGWYIGYYNDCITFVNRRTPEVCKHVSYGNVTVNHLFFLPYTNWLIVNTAGGCYRHELDTAGGVISIGDKIIMSECVSLIAVEEYDSAVIALSYVSTISLIWTASWKIHHSFACTHVVCMAVSGHHLVAITLQRDIYNWDCVTGNLLTVFKGGWHTPTHVTIFENVLELGILTLDAEKNILALWAVNKRVDFDWPVQRISSNVDLVLTYQFEDNIKAARLYNNNIVYSTCSEVVQTQLILKSQSWQKKWLSWVNDPRTSLQEPPTSQNAIIKTMSTWSSNIFSCIDEQDIQNSLADVSFMIEDPIVFAEFERYVSKHVQTMYGVLRETCFNLMTYFYKLNIRIAHVLHSLDLPVLDLDYVLWVVAITVYDIKPSTELRKHAWKSLKTDTLLILEFLDLVQDDIVEWDIFLHHANIFLFINSENVIRSCEEGYENNWLKLFSNIKHVEFYCSENVELAWKSFTSYVLDSTRISDYELPNASDGKWEETSVIGNALWVKVNGIVRHSSYVDPKLPVLVWVPHVRISVPNNSVERALHVLDNDRWVSVKTWKHMEHACEPGYRIKNSNGDHGIIISWPMALMTSGNVVEIKMGDSIMYRPNYCNFSIEHMLRCSATSLIVQLMVDNDIPDITDNYKSVILNFLKPDSMREISCILWDLPISTFNIDNGLIWFGTETGQIIQKHIGSSKNEHIEIFGHTSKINDIQFDSNKCFTASDDGTIRIWFQNRCIKTLSVAGCIHCINIVAHNVWFLNKTSDVCVWNYKMNRPPSTIEKNRDRAIIPSIITIGRVTFVATRYITQWYNRYPYTSKRIKEQETIICFALMTTDDYLVATYGGNVYARSVDDDDEILVWETDTESVTSLIVINNSKTMTAVIGTLSGKVFLVSVMDEYPTVIWDGEYSIVKLMHYEGHIIVLTSNYSVHSLYFDAKRVVRSCSALIAASHKKDWARYFSSGNKTEFIQDIIKKGYAHGVEDFSSVIGPMIENHDNRKDWCTVEILEILLNKRTKYKKIIEKLFCFRGKLFKCSLCLGRTTSPTSAPITMLKTCGHRFHKKCIETHISKTFEWNDYCRNSWALDVNLKCPVCRVEFGQDGLLEDRKMSDICKYESSEEEV